eukprot:TRINITY_DN3264_c0_g2_i1.p1 TRINITY_DN3264_c0_g2~~TRINITY_DN3264_c0_g2_i1.p1  ORF type:complete len:215 (-),score=57.54 TRINITY_DN3264_c0_g2_i1:1517-2161(-)
MSTAASSTVEKEQHLYKVVFLGDYACGKTSLIRRYVEGTFTPNYKLTIGVDFAVKNVEWNDSTTVSLQLWDVAGHERFGCMTSVYYKYAIAAIIVYDLSRPSTFDPVLKWRDDLNSKVVLSNDEPVPVVLLANKCDVPNVTIDREMLDQFCRENGFLGWFETSAKDNINIEKSMSFLIERILEVAKRNKVEQPEENTTLVSTPKETDEREKKCC